ncbi:hypothetical protein V144x_30070 [Gimesia aquarii]|uniref:Glycosyltransferase RgtA/B/C/D-like domain-containing protein n=2 Tax=Gimesia aquarii TaxID=2527964 RepID=A0A517VX15_9PLAN|nr:hypothetical protein V144x_30070 [Gimesia aquarii]
MYSEQFIWYCLLLLVVMMGAAGRVYGLGDLSLWFDECFCWKMSTFPLSEQWQRASQDNHPPLFYFILKVWTLGLGSSPATVRLLSVMFGLSTILGTFFLVREIEADVFKSTRVDPRVMKPALLAAALVALSPFQIEWSQTIRMYALGASLGVWASWALLRALTAPKFRTRDWIVYGFLAAGLIYTHYFGFFILAAHGLYGGMRILLALLSKENQRPLKVRIVLLPLLSVAIVGILWWPWMDEFLLQRQRGLEQEWGRPQGIDHLTRSVAEMFGFMWNPASTEMYRAKIIAILFSILTIIAFFFGRKSERFLGLIVLCSFGFALFLGSGSKSLIASWYFLFAHVFFLCAIAVMLFRIPSRYLSRIAITAVLISAGWQFAQQLQWRDTRIDYPSFQAAVNYVEALREKDELIFVNGPRDFVAVSPYLKDCDPMFVISKEWDFVFGTGTAVVSTQKHLTPTSVADLESQRAWVIFASNKSMYPKGVEMPKNWVDITEERFNDWRYGQIIVQQYERINSIN